MSSTPQQPTNPTTETATSSGTSTTPRTNGPPCSAPPASRLYFAYGSNLSTTQMASRCPDARPLHLARLPGWRFIINTRGVANIVPEDPGPAPAGSCDQEEGGVYGILYEIGAEDEESLDLCEGVPFVYEKVEMLVWVEPLKGGGAEGSVGDGIAAVSGDGEGLARTVALVYVDTRRTGEGRPREEYIGRMNRGIEEAGNLGPAERLPLPGWYVRDVMRRFIPV
ncbi:hypothetical protein NKR19_g6816 [Coniochaeta hoffmannii]|uniref:gamma-glutamylcyclotransferase n=1 Tax=Coniochaeta hoffmannii TaxID=91930 RepID=A0AA38RP98_9PEZI|nr:hypothetical protein NKR19_g6816 [Coniochaeta hoffmannii]